MSQSVLKSNKESMTAMQAEMVDTKDSIRQLKVSSILSFGTWFALFF